MLTLPPKAPRTIHLRDRIKTPMIDQRTKGSTMDVAISAQGIPSRTQTGRLSCGVSASVRQNAHAGVVTMQGSFCNIMKINMFLRSYCLA